MIVSFEFVWKYNIYCVKSKTLYILWVGLSMYGNSVYWMSHCFCPACWLEQITNQGYCSPASFSLFGLYLDQSLFLFLFTPTGFFTLIHIWSNFCSCYYLLQPDFFNLYNNWSNFSIFAVVTPIWLTSHFLILEFSFWKSVIYSNWSHSLYLWIGVNSSYFKFCSNSITSVFIPVGV